MSNSPFIFQKKGLSEDKFLTPSERAVKKKNKYSLNMNSNPTLMIGNSKVYSDEIFENNFRFNEKPEYLKKKKKLVENNWYY